MAQTAPVYGNPSSLTLTSTWSCTYYSTANQLGAITYHRSYGSPSTKTGDIIFDLTSLPSNITINSTKVYATVSNGNTYGSGTITVGGISFNRNTGYVSIANPSSGATSLTVTFTYKASNHSSTYHDSSSTSSSKTSSHSSPITFSNIYLVIDYTVNVTACTPPTSVWLSATSAGPGASVTLSWNGAGAGTNNAITGYHVYRTIDGGATYSFLTSVTTSSTSGSTTITAPTANGGIYYYRVYTIGSVDGYNSDGSTPAVALTCSYSSPNAPTNVSLSKTYATAGETITLSWSGASAGTNNPITGYHIYRDDVYLGDTTSTSFSLQAHDTAGGSYTYKVYTLGTYSNSEGSQSVVVYTYSDPTAPTSITLSNIISQGENATLSWSGASDGAYNAITGYDVYYRTSTDGVSWSDYVLYTSSDSTSCSVDPDSNVGSYRLFTIVSNGTLSASSRSTAAATMYHFGEFTDPTITAGETYIRAVHMTELQAVANNLRKCCGLSDAIFTTVTSGETSLAGWTDHVNELRTAIDDTGIPHDTWISFSVNCPRADVMTQLRNVILNA